MKKVEVTDRLAWYIEQHRENRENIANTESILLDAMIGLHYAREACEGGSEQEEFIQSAESAITDLHFILRQLRITDKASEVEQL